MMLKSVQYIHLFIFNQVAFHLLKLKYLKLKLNFIFYSSLSLSHEYSKYIFICSNREKESYFFFTERKDIGLNFVFHAPERMFLAIQVFDQLETDCRPCCILRQN